MANLPLESVIINPLERPTSKDINQLQMQAHQDMRMLAREMFYGQLGTYSDGFVGDGFKPTVLSAVDRTLNMLNGVMFQFRLDAENNIGGIQGLSDVYPYKAAFNYGGIAITIDDAPANSGFSRIDLIQMRVPIGDERLKDLTATGIFDPTLKTFLSENKPKLLSSTLTATDVQTIPAGTAPGTATQPIIYKLGTEGASPVAPVTETGYLTIATVTSTYGQADLLEGDISDQRNLLYLNPAVGGTGVSSLPLPVSNGGTGAASLPAGEVLLGNGTSGITSTAILPMTKGGTGRAPTAGDTLGSVAYLDSGTDQIKYTQAVDLFDIPLSGHLLRSNASGAPTWIAPGAVGTLLASSGSAWTQGPTPGALGQPLVSDGTDWVSLTTPPYYLTTQSGSESITGTTWQEFTTLSITGAVLRAGLARVRLQPRSDAIEDCKIALYKNVLTPNAFFYLKFEIEGAIPVISGGVKREFVYKFYLNTDTPLMHITMPAVEDVYIADTYSVKVYGKSDNGAASTGIAISNCSLFVSQG